MSRLALSLALLSLAACSGADLAEAAAPGQPVAAAVRTLPSGQLLATRLALVAPEDGEDQEGEHDGQFGNQDDGDVEEQVGDQVEEELEEDLDNDGDVDEDDYQVRSSTLPGFVLGRPDFIPERGVYQVLGVTVNTQGVKVAGTKRLDGLANGEGYLAAEAFVTAEGQALGGISQGVTATGARSYELDLLGQIVHVDKDTVILWVNNPMEEDALDVDEEDGEDVDCEQDGEFEGENAGC